MNGKYIVYVVLVCGCITSIRTTSDAIDAVTERMDQLEKENVRLTKQMEQQNVEFVKRITKLERQNVFLKEEMKEQLILDSQFVTTIELRDVIDNQEKQFVNYMTNATMSAGNKRRRSFEVPYAFSAVLDHNVEHSGIDQTVLFNRVLLNDGNAYNNHTGVFSVPTDGVYLFYLAFATGYAPHQLWMHIVVDGVGQVAGAADNLQSGHDAQGTNLVMLHLHQGDSVWVSTFAIPDVKIYGSTLFTTFSGVLLYQY